MIPRKIPFAEWIRTQKHRDDEVGAFARHFAGLLPASSRLYIILRYFESDPELRRLAKRVHAEWRLMNYYRHISNRRVPIISALRENFQ